jgi:MFS family permease
MSASPRLGLRENWPQFSLLVLVNAFVGAMMGMERSILPALAQEAFQLAAHTAILSFIVVFGITKALTNYAAGRWSDHFGRKAVLVGGWLVAVPVPFLLMWAPTWSWILGANVLLGISQGLTWSTTVIMKIDLAGPKHRGLATGLNEFAGYLAIALSALATGAIASELGLRPWPFALGVLYVAAGLLLSVSVVRETMPFVALASPAEAPTLSSQQVFVRTSLTDPDLSSVCQAGMVNNLNDGVAWGLFPLLFTASHMTLSQVGVLAATYPAVWGVGQLLTGPWSAFGLTVATLAVSAVTFASGVAVAIRMRETLPAAR